MKYILTYGRNTQLIWALILPAFILLIPLLIIIEYVLPLFPKDDDWLIIISTVGYFTSQILLTLLWVKATTAAVEIALDADLLQFSFLKRNIFHGTDFNLAVNEIKNVSEDKDKGYNFLYFETTHPDYHKFFIRAKEGEIDFKNFSVALLKLREDFNNTTTLDTIIKNKSIYQKPLMKWVGLLFFTSWFILPILLYFGEPDWLQIAKYLVFLVVSLPMVLKVYYQNFKK